uniref:Uncharacterized protein n=1 Tax=Salix viminalis TaxID=40686 RepID=A0A6N2L7H4_SALVM
MNSSPHCVLNLSKTTSLCASKPVFDFSSTKKLPSLSKHGRIINSGTNPYYLTSGYLPRSPYNRRLSRLDLNPTQSRERAPTGKVSRRRHLLSPSLSFIVKRIEFIAAGLRDGV